MSDGPTIEAAGPELCGQVASPLMAGAAKQAGTLGYAAAAARHRRRKVAAAVCVASLFAAAALACRYRPWLGRLWGDVQFRMAQYRCLTYGQPETRVAFDDDPARAQQLLGEGGYQRLGSGPLAAGIDCPPLTDLLRRAGASGFGWSAPPRRGTLFLHERTTASGRRVLAYAIAAVNPKNSEPAIGVVALDAPSWSKPPTFAGGQWFTLTDLSTAAGVPWRRGRPIRLFAGQPDGSDGSRFTVGYDCGGTAGRFTVRVYEGDPAATPGWVSASIEHGAALPTTEPTTGAQDEK